MAKKSKSKVGIVSYQVHVFRHNFKYVNLENFGPVPATETWRTTGTREKHPPITEGQTSNYLDNRLGWKNSLFPQAAS